MSEKSTTQLEKFLRFTCQFMIMTYNEFEKFENFEDWKKEKLP